MSKQEYDIVIIGSGMGGLLCGDVLSREGYKVCILEKNKQIGGCMQTYVRDKVIFDAGVHYLGGLAKGQNLYQIFKYLEIIDRLKLEQLDKNGFDHIIIGNDKEEYVYAQGYENFIRHLLLQFPAEEQALRLYCDKIKNVCLKFPLYNLHTGGQFNEKSEVMDFDTKEYIESITTNKKLQEVLAGNNMLYAGQPGKTPFYVHAMILNSYIESSWKCLDGGSQIAKYMAENIKKRGGVIKRDKEVEKIVVEDGMATEVLLNDGTAIHGKYFIANIHPAKALEMTETNLIKSIYRKRIKSLENSVSVFVINIVFKKDSFKYFKHNYYYSDEGQVWTMADYTEDNWPLGYALFLSGRSESNGYAESMTALAYMRYDEVEHWENSFNTVSAKEDRGGTYEAFKKYKAEILLDKVEERFPGLRTHIKSYYTATPLSYRDYIGNHDGSMYGIVKDYRSPLKSFIPTRTKLSNLYFTGQNLNLHGVLGAAMSGLVTCVTLMGSEEIIEKIKNA